MPGNCCARKARGRILFSGAGADGRGGPPFLGPGFSLVTLSKISASQNGPPARLPLLPPDCLPLLPPALLLEALPLLLLARFPCCCRRCLVVLGLLGVLWVSHGGLSSFVDTGWGLIRPGGGVCFYVILIPLALRQGVGFCGLWIVER